MAKHSVSIVELARKGATHRYHELMAELVTLVQHFPHLGSAVSPAMPIDLSSEPAAAIGLKPRKRRKMSAAARQKISEAQKKRWAARKAKKS